MVFILAARLITQKSQAKNNFDLRITNGESHAARPLRQAVLTLHHDMKLRKNEKR